MDRKTIYPFQIPYETDLLQTMRFVYEAFGLSLIDLLGTGTKVSGLACVPTAPASLNAKVAPGRIYALESLDPSSWGNVGDVGGLEADTAADHQILKQGLLRDTTTFAFTAPGTTGQSVNYLVQVAFSEADEGSEVLPFFNSDDPSVPWSGPNNSGASLTTLRNDKAAVSIKEGTAATTGSQTTPAPDAGNVGLWVITLANGQTTIASGDITAYSPSSFFENLGQKISQAAADARYQQLSPGSLLAHGCCYMKYASATQIILAPQNGNAVIVSGVQKQIPSGGIMAANTSVTINGTANANLASSTVYLVALNTSGTLEFWTLATGHGPDTTAGNVGVEVITGHADKTLVGMVATNSSSQFELDHSLYGVISWFNRKSVGVRFTDTNDRTITSASLTNFSTYNIPFISWADDLVILTANGNNSCTAVAAMSMGVNVNNTGSSSGLFTTTPPAINTKCGFNSSENTFVAEGLNTAYLLGASDSGTLKVLASNCNISLTIRG